MTEIAGTSAAGFGAVEEAFRAAFEGLPQMGAALSVWRDGVPVVDLWRGVADARTGAGWERNTAAVVFSCTKGLMSILIAQAVEAGRMTYDTPVAALWPEFAQAGKGDVTVGDALAHRAGLSAPRDWLSEDDIVDWGRMTARLAAQEPLWSPGQGYAYHAITHGWLAGEILRRATGLMPREAVVQGLSGPMEADVWLGLPEALEPRVAHSRTAPSIVQIWAQEAGRDSPEDPHWPYRAMTLGAALPPELVTEQGGFNAPRLHQAQIPGAGGIATARGLASVWSGTVAGAGRLLSAPVVAEATRERSGGAPVFDAPGPYARWGAGFQLDSEARRYLGPASFGHDGAGGQVAFADPDAGIGFAFVTNWMMATEDTRATRIIDALRDAV
ncbi:serine hydrolase domain-containing protein [Pseudoroseicyclus aestuarii]|uniref:CubicO group peptidase (Beta-lactamase class C family) n=1 Tax=Pseudoroseicyclus aestuarii TaxID=1795041 RepID=A0A318T495_9RHOB|nr:serine hydrolase domain-containing protein [Pseudoroseicyclus aestuarii]PYE81338.1 CubicO group peptidase (beta-lactamase class C family) [Pseudoroseicyclus aestuarii]